MTTFNKECRNCLKEFQADRRDNLYCSHSCRSSYYYKRKKFKVDFCNKTSLNYDDLVTGVNTLNKIKNEVKSHKKGNKISYSEIMDFVTYYENSKKSKYFSQIYNIIKDINEVEKHYQYLKNIIRNRDLKSY